MLRTILLIILILALLGSVPLWPYSAGWGYGPSGGAGLLLISSFGLAPELEQLIRAGFQVIGQRWTALRELAFSAHTPPGQGHAQGDGHGHSRSVAANNCSSSRWLYRCGR